MNRQGFTLIEIVVVLIILGVLAMLSIKSYFSWIQRADLAEGLSLAKSINDQMTICVQAHDVPTCNALAPFGIPNTAHFQYKPWPMGPIFLNRWITTVERGNSTSSSADIGTGTSILCTGSAGSAHSTAGNGSLIGICHNFNGDGTNYTTGTGYYQGL